MTMIIQFCTISNLVTFLRFWIKRQIFLLGDFVQAILLKKKYCNLFESASTMKTGMSLCKNYNCKKWVGNCFEFYA